MIKDKRRLASVLASELIFLDSGGYEVLSHLSSGATSQLEGSPACPNFHDDTRATACRDCCLLQLVPLRHHDRNAPCRHIPLNAAGQTIETLSRTGAKNDLDLIYRQWLLRTLDHLKAKEDHQTWVRNVELYRAADHT